MTDVSVPDIGDFKDVEVIDVLVKVGDSVAIETPLVTLETDKATMDVPSSAAGKITAIAVKKGDRVSKGSVLISLQAADAPTEAKPASKPASSSANEQPAAAKPSSPEQSQPDK